MITFIFIIFILKKITTTLQIKQSIPNANLNFNLKVRFSRKSFLPILPTTHIRLGCHAVCFPDHEFTLPSYLSVFLQGFWELYEDGDFI